MRWDWNVDEFGQGFVIPLWIRYRTLGNRSTWKGEATVKIEREREGQLRRWIIETHASVDIAVAWLITALALFLLGLVLPPEMLQTALHARVR
jgi:hypothetical protein